MKLTLSKTGLCKLYSYILPWLPLLTVYKSIIPGVSLAELLLVIICIFLILTQSISLQKLSSYESLLLLFSLYSIIVTTIVYILGNWYETSWLNRIVRFTFYVFVILLISKNCFVERAFFKSINITSTILLFGIVIQYVFFYATGKYIRFYDSFLPIMTSELLDIDYSNIFGYSAFRPSSLFTEPSHLAQFEIIPLIYNAYKLDSDNKQASSKYVLFVFIAILNILLSKSLWGYLLITISLLFWLYDTSNKSHKAAWFVVIPIVIIMGLIIIIRTNLLADTLSRLNIHDITNSLSFSGRFGGYQEYFDLGLLRIIFGSGFGAIIYSKIANSILFILVGEGIVGLLLIIVLLFSLLINIRQKWKRLLLVTFIMLLFGSNIFFSINFVLVMSILFNSTNDSLDNFIEQEV